MCCIYLPIYVKTQRESPNLIESIMFSTRKRRRSSTIAPFNLFVALFANSFTRSGAMVTSIPKMKQSRFTDTAIRQHCNRIALYINT